jgi:hypothetical protein
MLLGEKCWREVPSIKQCRWAGYFFLANREQMFGFGAGLYVVRGLSFPDLAAIKRKHQNNRATSVLL